MEKQEFIEQVDRLLYQLQAKDSLALTSLYDLTASKLLGVIYRVLRDRCEAEEVLQEIFIKVWQDAYKFSGQGTAWGWLCVMSRNAALDQLRKLKPHSRIASEEPDDMFEAFLNDDNLLQQYTINGCLQKLHALTRQSVLMSFVYGYSHQELADKLATPLGTIKTRLRRGLQDLKACLS